MARIKRKLLSEELAEAITKEIAAGVWKERLPGYRVLGKRYDVSRPTCERALAVLEANGVVGPAEPGKMRPVLRKRFKKMVSARMNLLIVIDSRHPPSPLDAETLMQVEIFWKAEGGEVSRVECDLMRNSKPSYLLKKWIRALGADCLVFETIASAEWIMATEKLGLPCYAFGGASGGRGILSRTGFQVTKCIEKSLPEILKLGHRRILLVIGRATVEQEMRNMIQEVTDPILEKDWGPEEVSFSVMIPDLVHPKDWQSWWRETLPRERPTIVLTESVFQAVCLHDICLNLGIQMPLDMSMMVLEDAEFLQWLSPLPTRYRYQYEEAFRHFKDWVRGGFAQGSIKFFSGEFIMGETLGPVSKKRKVKSVFGSVE